MSSLSKETVKILLVALKKIADKAPHEQTDERCGICDNLISELVDSCYIGHDRACFLACKVTPIFERWDKFSGDIAFPVPAPCPSSATPLQAYLRNRNKWEGEYGDLRYELLNFTITEFEKWLTRPKRKAIVYQIKTQPKHWHEGEQDEYCEYYED